MDLENKMETDITEGTKIKRNKYKKDINHILDEHDVNSMLLNCTGNYATRNKALISFLYLTGARPIEVTKLRPMDITLDGVQTVMRVFTAKLGNAKKSIGFMPPYRLLEFDPSTPFLEYLHTYRHSMEVANVPFLFPISVVRIKHIVYETSKGKFCPYNFRHSRLWKMAEDDASIPDLMAWKGASDHRSVNDYIRGKRIGKKFKIR